MWAHKKWKTSESLFILSRIHCLTLKIYNVKVVFFSFHINTHTFRKLEFQTINSNWFNTKRIILGVLSIILNAHKLTLWLLLKVLKHFEYIEHQSSELHLHPADTIRWIEKSSGNHLAWLDVVHIVVTSWIIELMLVIWWLARGFGLAIMIWPPSNISAR